MGHHTQALQATPQESQATDSLGTQTTLKTRTLRTSGFVMSKLTDGRCRFKLNIIHPHSQVLSAKTGIYEPYTRIFFVTLMGRGDRCVSKKGLGEHWKP